MEAEGALRVVVAGLCGYEAVAISTGAVPTLSAYMWRLPSWARAVVWGGVIVVLTDHFFTRHWT